MAGDAGVVDEQVEAAVLVDDGRERRAHLLAVADVHFPVADARLPGLRLAGDEVGRHHLPALVAQMLPDGPADPARSSGDDRDTAHAMFTPPSTL